MARKRKLPEWILLDCSMASVRMNYLHLNKVVAETIFVELYHLAFLYLHNRKKKGCAKRKERKKRKKKRERDTVLTVPNGGFQKSFGGFQKSNWRKIKNPISVKKNIQSAVFKMSMSAYRDFR